MKKTTVTKWFKPNFDIENGKDSNNDHSTGIPIENKNIRNTRNKTVRNTRNKKKELISVKDTLNINLLERIAPQNVSDLAVHNKKVSEIQSWLTDNVVLPHKMAALLLTGPTGSGKTATIRVLCNLLGINIIEWINPCDLEIEEIYEPSQTTKFTEFLMESSRYPSLFINDKSKQVVLVEDFPNSIVHNPQEFEKILDFVFKCGKFSVIFICTETKDNSLDLARQLFPDNIKMKYPITTISLNSISVTLLKSALKRACDIIHEKYKDIYQLPPATTIDCIVNSAMGDVRNAINYLNFACLKGSGNLPTTIQISQAPGTKRKRNEKDKSTLTNMSRDEPLDLFHGVGRVLYPKRVELPNYWKLERQPKTIVDQFLTMPTLFVSFLQENYLRCFGDFSEASQAAEILSTAELLLNNWQDSKVVENGLWIAIMGLMVKNKHVITKWNPIQGPKNLKRKNNDEFFGKVKIDPIDTGYYNIIKPLGFTSKKSFKL